MEKVKILRSAGEGKLSWRTIEEVSKFEGDTIYAPILIIDKSVGCREKKTEIRTALERIKELYMQTDSEAIKVCMLQYDSQVPSVVSFVSPQDMEIDYYTSSNVSAKMYMAICTVYNALVEYINLCEKRGITVIPYVTIISSRGDRCSNTWLGYAKQAIDELHQYEIEEHFDGFAEWENEDPHAYKLKAQIDFAGLTESAIWSAQSLGLAEAEYN